MFREQRFRIRTLPECVQTAIETAQPYNRLKPGQWFAPLWWLSQLHDVDKHRFSHLGVTALTPDEIAIDARPGTYRAEWNAGLLVDGAPVLRVFLTEPNPDVKVDLKATGAVVLNVKGIKPISFYWVTRRIRREVGVACRYLEGFFPSS